MTAPCHWAVLITGDEEVGGYNGARSTLGGINCDFCIALDGGRVDKIVIKEKGILRLKEIEFTSGKTAPRGKTLGREKNAIEKLMADCLVVKGFFAGLSEPEHWHRSMNLAVIHAGDSVNQVPDKAEAMFDIRYTENDQVDDLIQQIQAAVSGRVITEEREPLFISPGVTLSGSPAGSGHGYPYRHCPRRQRRTLPVPNSTSRESCGGADGNSSQHSTEEHVEIQSISRLYDILDRFVTDILENPNPPYPRT